MSEVPRALKEHEARVGLRVLHAGERRTDGVMTPELRELGRGLEPGHPGVISRLLPGHLQVAWLGLEEEPESWGVGYDHVGEGIYPTLHPAAAVEWEYAISHGWWAEWASPQPPEPAS